MVNNKDQFVGTVTDGDIRRYILNKKNLNNNISPIYEESLDSLLKYCNSKNKISIPGWDLKNIKLTLFDDSNVPFIELSGNEITTSNDLINSIGDPTYYWDFRVASSTSITDSVGGLTATYMNGITSSVANGAYFAGGGVSSGEYNYINVRELSQRQRRLRLNRLLKHLIDTKGETRAYNYIIKALTARSTLLKRRSPVDSKIFKEDQEWMSEKYNEIKRKRK